MTTMREIEESGVIPVEYRRRHPTVHFCPDWDYMLTREHMPEADCCTCSLMKIMSSPAERPNPSDSEVEK